MSTQLTYDPSHIINQVFDNALTIQNKYKELSDNARDANATHQHFECNDVETIIVDNGDGCSDLSAEFSILHKPNIAGKTGLCGLGSRYALLDRDHDKITFISGENKMSIDLTKLQATTSATDYISYGVPSPEEKLQISKIQTKTGMNQIGLVIIIKHATNSCHTLNNYAKSINNVTAPPSAKDNLAFTLDYDHEFKITFRFDDEEKIHIFKSFIQLQNEKLVNEQNYEFFYIPSDGTTYIKVGDKYIVFENIDRPGKSHKFKRGKSIEDVIDGDYPGEVPIRGVIVNSTQGPAHDNFIKTKMEDGYNNTKDNISFKPEREMFKDIYDDPLKQLGYENGFDDIKADRYDVLSNYTMYRKGSAIRSEKNAANSRTGRLNDAKPVLTQSKIMVGAGLDGVLGFHANKHMPTKLTPISILNAVKKSRMDHQDTFIFNYSPYNVARKLALQTEHDRMLAANNLIQDDNDEQTLYETSTNNVISLLSNEHEHEHEHEPTLDEISNNNIISNEPEPTNPISALTSIRGYDSPTDSDTDSDTESKKCRKPHMVKPHISGPINIDWLRDHIMTGTLEQICDLITADDKLARELVNKVIQDPVKFTSYKNAL